MAVESSVDPKKVAEKVYKDLSLKDVLADVREWKRTLELHAIASAELQREKYNDLGHWQSHTAMQVIFGHDCIVKADLIKAGEDVPQSLKDSCWEWQKTGAPMEYGTMLALWHLDTYAELLHNPNLVKSDAEGRKKDDRTYQLIIEDLKDRYTRYLEDANEAYGVNRLDRARFLMDPVWLWSWWVWKQLTRGRDCWFSDNPEACLDIRHTRRFQCIEACDVMTSHCGIDQYYTRVGNFIPSNPNVYYWYVHSWDQTRIDAINECWTQYKGDLPDKYKNMKSITQMIKGLHCTGKDYAIHNNTAVRGQGTGGPKLERSAYSSDEAYLNACKAQCDDDSTCAGFVDDHIRKQGRMCKPKTAFVGRSVRGKTFYVKGNGC